MAQDAASARPEGSFPKVQRLLGEATHRKLLYYPRAFSALRYVQSRLPEATNLSDVARFVSMSPTAFSRYFTIKVGRTFSCVTKVVRIAHALDRLEQSDCSISSLARQCGYSDAASFIRAFKGVTGTTPTEYRRLLLSGSVLLS